jgi:hypothetical protein
VFDRDLISVGNVSEELEAVSLCDATPSNGQWSSPREWSRPSVSATNSYPGRTNGVMVTATSPSLDVMVLAFDSPQEAASWLSSAQSAFQACQRWQSFVSTYERIDIGDSASGAWIRWSSIEEYPSEASFAARAAGSFIAAAYIEPNRSGLVGSYQVPVDALLGETLAKLNS